MSRRVFVTFAAEPSYCSHFPFRQELNKNLGLDSALRSGFLEALATEFNDLILQHIFIASSKWRASSILTKNSTYLSSIKSLLPSTMDLDPMYVLPFSLTSLDVLCIMTDRLFVAQVGSTRFDPISRASRCVDES